MTIADWMNARTKNTIAWINAAPIGTSYDSDDGTMTKTAQGWVYTMPNGRVGNPVGVNADDVMEEWDDEGEPAAFYFAEVIINHDGTGRGPVRG